MSNVGLKGVEMVKEVEFQATLPDVHTAIAISGDGSSKIRLDVPDCD